LLTLAAFLDTYSKLALAKLYDRKTPLVAADPLLNDRVIAFFDDHANALRRVPTERGAQYCGAPERHEYELYLAVENVDHTGTGVKSAQTNGIVERLHRTVLNEFYRAAFRRKPYVIIERLQADLDGWLKEYKESNELRPHQGRWCYGKTPLRTFADLIALAREKILSPAVPAHPALFQIVPQFKTLTDSNSDTRPQIKSVPNDAERLTTGWWCGSATSVARLNNGLTKPARR